MVSTSTMTSGVKDQSFVMRGTKTLRQPASVEIAVTMTISLLSFSFHAANDAKPELTTESSTRIVHRALRESGPCGVPRSYNDENECDCDGDM